MSKVVTRRLFLATGCLALCLVVVPAAEAVTYNVDCAALNGPTSDPRINQQGNDVVVNCGLDVRTLIIRAHTITVNPPGFIRTAGLGGMNLYAGLDSMNTKCVDPDPATARININGAHLEDLNRNGGVVLKGCGDINVANLPEPLLGAINLIDAEMRNDFGKTGHISITAHPALMKNGKPLDPDSVPLLPPAGFTGDGSINILNAIFIDNGALEGPQNVSFMNGFRDSIPGNCNATPTCQQKAIPLFGFVADPNSRASHNVLNAFFVRCDS